MVVIISSLPIHCRIEIRCQKIFYFTTNFPYIHRAGANAMLLASRKGDLLTCKMLAGAGIDPSSQQSGDPCNPACDLTPMMVASFCGHFNLVKYFLECGEDVDQRSPSLGVSCLIMAALGGHEVLMIMIMIFIMTMISEE